MFSNFKLVEKQLKEYSRSHEAQLNDFIYFVWQDSRDMAFREVENLINNCDCGCLTSLHKLMNEPKK